MKDSILIIDKESLNSDINELIALLVESSEGRSLMEILSITKEQDTECGMLCAVKILFKKKATYASIM